MVFPRNTLGLSLDTLARRVLWVLGVDYRHSAGYGVGAALNDHEGPQSISRRYHITAGMQMGMVVSNEPGQKEEGAFGFRIEHLVAVRKAETPVKFGNVPYLSFERLTLMPFQRKLMDLQAMTQMERDWVDAYHSEVWDKVSPRVSGSALEWLRVNTAPLEVGVAQKAPELVAA